MVTLLSLFAPRIVHVSVFLAQDLWQMANFFNIEDFVYTIEAKIFVDLTIDQILKF